MRNLRRAWARPVVQERTSLTTPGVPWEAIAITDDPVPGGSGPERDPDDGLLREGGHGSGSVAGNAGEGRYGSGAGEGVPESLGRAGGYASLKDVASRAGVSFQTVSKVLNGGGSVSPATLERIRRAAEEVGYVPNALARGLVTRGTKTLGIIAADPSDHVLGRFVVAAEVEARRRGWATVVANVDAFGSDVGRYVEVLSERRVDGILMAAPQAEGDPTLGARLRGRFPVVSLHTIQGLRVPLIGSDHVETGLLAVRHLILHGHRAIGMVSGTPGRYVTAARMTGYARAFSEARLEPGDSELVEEGDWTTAGGYLATMRLLDRSPRVTALYVHNDYMAIGAIRALYERGRAVPGDVAVVGCDDAPLAAYTVPSLTTVRVPFEDTGREAMALLLRMVTGGAAPATSTLLPVELVARASCGCAVASAAPAPAPAPSVRADHSDDDDTPDTPDTDTRET